MPAFRANIVNLPGYGEHVTKFKNGGWSRDKYQFKLGGHDVTVKQRRAVLNKKSQWRGKQIDTSTVYVSKVKSLEQGKGHNEAEGITSEAALIGARVLARAVGPWPIGNVVHHYAAPASGCGRCSSHLVVFGSAMTESEVRSLSV